ncbi:MAG: ParA family protein [Patescibacteria group bacterium]|nr:ParA family protein [Patescibacteria group bacterium]
MARVIAVCNQKGGVGKTTTSVNLASYLAIMGRKVLLVDFDPQANASSALGVDPMKTERSVYHGIIGAVEPQHICRTSALSNLDLFPAAPHLAGALVELVSVPERESYLRKFLHRVRHQYHYIFIDLPPSLSLLTVNGLVASDEVLIPVQAEYYSLEGIGQLLQTVKLIRDNLKHPLSITGALITMYDKREKLSREVAWNLRKNFPHKVFDVEIPRSVALAEAPSFSKPVALYRPDSTGALAYQRLAHEVLLQERALTSSNHFVSPDFGNFALANN